MSVIQALDDEEKYLVALMDDPAGIDLAEAFWTDDTPGRAHRRYRVWDYQWPWYQNESTYQIDQAGRSLGKSQGILMRACAFPFNYPGQEMLITAPELNHLGPIVDKVEEKFLNIRFFREMLPSQKGGGIKHQPQFVATFLNGSRIMGRLPQRTGIGVKGSHPLVLEMDECFPAGTLVLTRRGQVPIEKVRVGDQVLTHRNRWQLVTATANRDRQVVRVRGQGHPGIVCSIGHKFWAARTRNVLVRNGDAVAKTRVFDEPEYIRAEDLEGSFWCSPTTFPKVPAVSIPSLRPGRGSGRYPLGYQPMIDVRAPATYWMVGLYLAEGSTGSSWGKGQGPPDRLTFSIHEDEVDEVLRRARGVGFDLSGPYPIGECRGVNLVCYSLAVVEVAEWLVRHFGEGSHKKQIASWALGLSRECRKELLAGLIYGDGFYASDERYIGERMKLTTVSRALAVTARLIGLSLGYSVSMYWCDTSGRDCLIRGRKVVADGFYQVVFNEAGQGFKYKNKRFTGVREVVDLDRVETLYDLTVEKDHSFIADGLIVSNSQDYPRQGWIELIETMKSGTPGAQWRAHGVSNGVRDMYYRMTSEEADLPFYVHKYSAMYRPTWSAQERREKIAIYGGSRDNPDYKRNIYGSHGSVSDRVFVLSRLLAATRIQESTWAVEYNENVYAKIKIEGESMEGRPIGAFLHFPASHLNKAYASYWAGMDLGFTSDPSELLVFGQIRQRKNDQDIDVLRLLSRIHMMRISAVDQEEAIEEVFKFYGTRLRALSMDKTGAGLPVWQHMDAKPELRARVKGYGFSEKRAVEFDDRPLVGREQPTDAMIEKNVIEFATDKLREYVDAQMIELPYDQELLTEWQGQTVVYSRDPTNARSQKRYGSGSFHTLDAAKLMILGKELEAIELAMAPKRRRGPVLDGFLG